MNYSTDSEVDRALGLCLSPKSVEAEQKVEIETEIDRELAPFRRKVFKSVGFSLLFFLLVEFGLIFFFLSDRNVLRAQTANGAMTMLGALALVTGTTLLVLLPTKIIAYRGYQMARGTLILARQGQATMSILLERATEFMAEARRDISRASDGLQLNELKISLERKLDELTQTVDNAIGSNDPVLPPEELERRREAILKKRAGAQPQKQERG